MVEVDILGMQGLPEDQEIVVVVPFLLELVTSPSSFSLRRTESVGIDLPIWRLLSPRRHSSVYSLSLSLSLLFQSSPVFAWFVMPGDICCLPPVNGF